MGFGIFGKLPQKRDFVTYGIPRGVLSPFETWLQSAVAASRSELGRNWEDMYLVAPIWRFWIGREIFGQACMGALMSSVDKVGRFFPLAIIYSEDEMDLAPPPFNPREDWFAAVETRLLSVLDERDEDDEPQLAAITDGLDRPDLGDCEVEGERFKGGTLWRAQEGTTTSDLVSSLVQADYRNACSARSFWWTTGGATGLPTVYAGAGLPDPYFLSRMLRATS